MKNFLYSIFFIFIFFFTGTIIFLSTVGFETSKFNNLIVKEVKKKDYNIDINLEKIKIKLDLKKIQLSLSTNNPKIIYQDIKIPVTEIKVYSKINKIFNSKIEIKRIAFSVEKLKIQNMQKIITRFKPSNFKNYLLNNIDNGEIEKVSIDLSIDKDFKIIDYTAKGIVKNINAVIKNNLTIKDINFNFITDSSLTLVNSINANYEEILLSNGSISLQSGQGIDIDGKFNTQFNLKKQELNKLFKNIKFFKEHKTEIKGILYHEFNLKLDSSFKVVDYSYKSKGDISESKLILKDSFGKEFIEKPIKQILFDKISSEINLKKNKKYIFSLDGLYSTSGSSYKKFKIQNNLKNKDYVIDLNLSENFNFDIINFRTNSNKISNIKTELKIKNNKFFFKSIDFTEGKNFISLKEMILNKKKEIEKIASIDLLTFDKSNKENNNFKINFKKKISIVGERYDSTNLLKLLSSDNNNNNLFKNFSNEIEVKLKHLKTRSQVPLSNFNLIGFVKKGKFNKVSAKSNFSKDKYLDVSLKIDPNGKKILEVYSDLPQVLLVDYKFFEGLKNGKLLYRSIADKKGSVSKLIIDDFKVVKVPVFAKLLTLADLSGFADLLSGKGMSFDTLEINMKDDLNITTIDEILALGPSVSLQMNGYIDKKTKLVNLSGTLVPAKSLNKIVSKIPIVGNILVGDKVGEGVFGVSFKMKGLPEQIKTTVNPVKTLTPRFVLRALEKIKKK